MPTHRIRRAAALLAGEAGLADKAPIYVSSSDSKIHYVPASTGTTEAKVGDSLTGLAVTSPTGSVGFAAGAGGAVTQITTSATGVTLNKPCGQITTVALTTAAAAEERFTVTNSQVVATDVIVVGTTYNGAGTPAVSVTNIAAGAFDIVITNLHASSALNALMVINFAVVKAVAA